MLLVGVIRVGILLPPQPFRLRFDVLADRDVPGGGLLVKFSLAIRALDLGVHGRPHD